MNRKTIMPGLQLLVLAALLAAPLGGALAQGAPPRGEATPWPPQAHFHTEHPRHRMAWWYANESLRQAEQARDMMCGFAGQRWTLDWDSHYRWALRASERRVYQRIEDRDRHLATCRSRKLRDYQRQPYRRDPGGYGRG